MRAILLGAGDPRGDAPGYPSYLQPAGPQLNLERKLASIARVAERQIVVIRREDDDRYHVGAIIEQVDPSATIVVAEGTTAGAACSALLAVDHLDPDDELLVTNLSDYVDTDLAPVVGGFRARRAAAGTVVFDSLYPRFSFVRLGGERGDEVLEVAEKNPISRHATAGLYWFARAGDFVDAAKSMIMKRNEVEHAFFVAPTFNEMILAGALVLAARIDPSQYSVRTVAGPERRAP